MLFQEAIFFLIGHLEKYLSSHLNVDPGIVEKQLAEQLQLKVVELTNHENNSEKDQNNAHDWVTLPNLENGKYIDLFKLVATSGTDQALLKFSSISPDFIFSSVDMFTTSLNNLKENPLPINKLLILYRFEKHLILLSEYAKKSLQERGKKYFEDKTRQFQGSVDEWLVKHIQGCIDDSCKLLSVALKNAPTPIGASLTIEHGAGQTEIMLKTCGIVLEECLQFCTKVNTRCNRNISDPLSMVDVFPQCIDQHNNPLMFVNLQTFNYFVGNMFDHATYRSYVECNITLPFNFYLYDPQVAEKKRQQLIDTLCDFKEKTQKHINDQPALWDSIFSCLHEADRMQALFTPSYTFKTQKSHILWKELHSTLYTMIPTNVEPVKLAHKLCNLH